MHHADLDVDVTTGTRFHVIEVGLSMILKFGVIVAIGASAVAVVVFEILLNAGSLFNHANVALPGAVDRRLRWLVVTPDMHRVHHSIDPAERNRNFGFTVPWWDWLFATYRAEPQAGHDRMILGIAQFRDHVELRLDRLLTQPFRNPEPRPAFSERPAGR
jgi:sterol desaturase/sphingolipid hydroxylase (fatty acid hydroxylase superfamily)